MYNATFSLLEQQRVYAVGLTESGACCGKSLMNVKQLNQITRTACAVLLGISSTAAFADTELPLYVAEDGTDSGNCTTLASPCASISYALGRAGKSSQVRVAAGRYSITNAADAIRIVSGATDIVGGYRFSTNNPNDRSGTTVLVGVPPAYREQLSARGFDIVADQKGVSTLALQELTRIKTAQDRLKSGVAAANCVGGMASGLPCSDVDLLSHVGHADISAVPQAGNDIWGFVDLNTHREYAIAGYNSGTAVFDVTDATNPKEVGFVDGQSEVWRDMKVYQYYDSAASRWQAYAYVTTDGSTTDGLFVIDLTGLPHSISRVNYPSDILSAHNVYATNTDYSTGISLTGDTPTLILAGSNLGIGQYRSYSLANPAAPAFIAGASGTGYMHDASSVIITDNRKDTQCVNSTTHCEILLDYNELEVEIWDITNTSNPVRLSTTPYPDLGYVHSGWWSEDKQFLFVQDETDELNFDLPTTLRVFSMADFRAPVLLPGWTGSTGAIDHNGFVRGNRYYMSNYSRGLTVLDITDPANPTEAGRLDTFPGSDVRDFLGAWGTYPFFHSGNVAISDRESGMYMAADQTRAVPQGMMQFSSASFAADEGQQAQLRVLRTGGTTGAISVDYEVLHATADASDYATTTGTLNWATGNSADQTIDLDFVNDGVSEPMERLLVRLVNPTGGATLGNLSTASAYISEPGSTSTINFSEASVSMTERGFATVVAVVSRGGSATGTASVDLTAGGTATAGDDYTGTIPSTLSWAAGDGDPKTIEFSIVDDGTGESDETITLTLNNPTGAVVGAGSNFTATILDGRGANTAPNAIAGPAQTRQGMSQVTLDGSQSNDPDGDALEYQWEQITGPSVTLNDPTSAIAAFTAPNVSSDTLFQFQLTVTDPGGLSDSAVANVTVTFVQPGPGGGGGGGSSGGGSLGLWALLTLGLATIRRRFSRKDVA